MFLQNHDVVLVYFCISGEGWSHGQVHMSPSGKTKPQHTGEPKAALVPRHHEGPKCWANAGGSRAIAER